MLWLCEDRGWGGVRGLLPASPWGGAPHTCSPRRSSRGLFKSASLVVAFLLLKILLRFQSSRGGGRGDGDQTPCRLGPARISGSPQDSTGPLVPSGCFGLSKRYHALCFTGPLHVILGGLELACLPSVPLIPACARRKPFLTLPLCRQAQRTPCPSFPHLVTTP